MIEKPVYLRLMVVLYHLDQLVVLPRPLNIRLQSDNLPYLVPQLQLAVRLPSVHHIQLLNLVSPFLEHSSKTLPDNRKTISFPLVPIDIFLTNWTKLIAMPKLRRMKPDGGVKSLLSSFPLSKVREVGLSPGIGHRGCSPTHLFLLDTTHIYILF